MPPAVVTPEVDELPSVEAVVSTKGQVTLPAAMRARLGIGPGYERVLRHAQRL